MTTGDALTRTDHVHAAAIGEDGDPAHGFGRCRRGRQERGGVVVAMLGVAQPAGPCILATGLCRERQAKRWRDKGQIIARRGRHDAQGHGAAIGQHQAAGLAPFGLVQIHAAIALRDGRLGEERTSGPHRAMPPLARAARLRRRRRRAQKHHEGGGDLFHSHPSRIHC
jgi:hypothetical protein